MKPTNKAESMVCDICGVVAFLVVDHNHATGYIRGLLCDRCNQWLGDYEGASRSGGWSKYDAWCNRYYGEIEQYRVRTSEYVYKAKSIRWGYRDMRLYCAGVPMANRPFLTPGRYGAAVTQRVMDLYNAGLERHQRILA